jgi:hypothetical protein
LNVSPYSADILAEALHNDYTSEDVIRQKNHFRYLTDYFGENGLKIKTIITENDYISKDYLKDFAAYYVSCFSPYEKHTKRLHFFSNSFDENEFKNNLLSKSKKSQAFWKHYCGFVVVKPIPITVIGTTVLKTYSTLQKEGGRKFWGTRPYKVHLFGKEIILDSLAFQEQDSVLSACATSSIWTVLHKAAEDYSIVLKTPGEITNDAGMLISDESRLFPNKDGLQVKQMCRALQSSGLEVDVRFKSGKNKGVDAAYLKKIVNAYSTLGLPIILLIEVPSGFETGEDKQINYGLHAVSVTGFKQKNLNTLNKILKHSGFYKLIEKIYVHDDQWGPFTRVAFSGENTLTTPWTELHESKILPPTNIEGLIIPLFPKVRISYDDMEPLLLAIAGMYKTIFLGILPSGFVWDMKLMYSECYKQDVMNSELENETKLKLISKNFPKYIWVATCYCKETKTTDFIFDATGISNAMLGIEIVMYHFKIKEHFNQYLIKNTSLQDFFYHRLKKEYYTFLIDHTKS